MKASKARNLALTGLLLALLIVFQAITKSFGQLVTGSCVNLILAVAALLCGLGPALTAALISPFFAFLLGIGPAFIQFVPVIALGNASYVLLLYFLPKSLHRLRGSVGRILAVVVASCFKALFLYSGIVRLILPLLISSKGIPEKKVSLIGASFSWPQLLTALIGGLLAVSILPVLKKAQERVH